MDSEDVASKLALADAIWETVIAETTPKKYPGKFEQT
jgi:hypothetical protein